MINKSIKLFLYLFFLCFAAASVGAEKETNSGNDKETKRYVCTKDVNDGIVYCDCTIGACGDMMDVCRDSMECNKEMRGVCSCEADMDKLRVIDQKRYGKGVSNTNSNAKVHVAPGSSSKGNTSVRDHRKARPVVRDQRAITK